MNEQLLIAAGIDFAAALARFGGDRELYRMFLRRFPDDTNFHDGNALLVRRDYSAAEMPIHTLKGIAGNLGFTTIEQLCRELLLLIRSGRSDGEDLRLRLESEYRRPCDALCRADV